MGGMKSQSSSPRRPSGARSDSFSSSLSVCANPVRPARSSATAADESAALVAADNDTDLVTVDAQHGTVRILIGLDVPVAAYPQIEADWSHVTAALANSPECVPEVVTSALQRLIDQAVAVSGVATAEPLPNPLTVTPPPRGVKDPV